MLSLDTLTLFLSIDESYLIDEFVLGLLASPQLALFLEKYPSVKRSLTKRIPAIRQGLENALRETRVPRALAEEFYHFQEIQLLSPSAFRQALPITVDMLTRLPSPFASEAQTMYQSATWHGAVPGEGFQVLFLQRWRISLTLQATTLHHKTMEKERELLQEELQQHMAMSGALSPILSENDQAAGRLWDMTTGNRHQQDYRLLIDYGEFLQQQPELLQLAEQLGRSREANFVAAPASPSREVIQRIKEPAIQPEEVSGIHQSDDLWRLLPAEMATLGLNELEFEFYRRLLEKRLLSYRLHGEAWRERMVRLPARSERFQEQPRGPFIVCVDTSGSMGGFNENCAKAFCLALMRIALADNRRCFVTLFSTGQVSYELTAIDGIEQAIRFLGQRFRGGTDLAGCIGHLAEKLGSSDWRDADAVVISDFIAQRLPGTIASKIKQRQQQSGQRFHAVTLSLMGKPAIMQIFDHIWQFDTGLKNRLMRRLHRR